MISDVLKKSDLDGFDIPYLQKRNYYMGYYFKYWQESLMIDKKSNEDSSIEN